MFDAEDHVHDWKVSKVLKAVTCENDGELEYTCTCGETKTEVVKASEQYHDYYLYKTVEESKMEVHKCKICGKLKTVAIEEEECDHEGATIVDTDSAKPCTIPGTRIINCPKCGEIVEKLPLKDHEAAAGAKGYILEDAVECVSDGLEEVKCKWCNKDFERVIPAHDFVETSRKAATCKEYEEITYTCSVCRKATKVEVGTELLEHTYSITSEQKATCTVDGSVQKVCTVCKTIKEEKLKATGHSIYKLDSDKKPIEDLVADFAHIYVNPTNGKAIKIKENGNILTISEEEYTEGMRDCEYDIAESYTCPLCEKPIINVVSKAYGNHIAKGNVAKGILVYDPITEKLEVNYDEETDDVVFVKDGVVDCTHAEVEVFTCGNDNCRKLNNEVIRVTRSTSHEPSTTKKYHPATCEDDACYTYSCKFCKEPIVEPATTKATGHKFYVQDATCTEPAKLACKNPKCVGITAKADEAKDEWLEDTKNAEEAKKLTDQSKPVGHNFVGKTSTVVKEEKAYILCNADGCDNDNNRTGIEVTVIIEGEEVTEDSKATVTCKIGQDTYTYEAEVSNCKKDADDKIISYTVTVTKYVTGATEE